MSCHKNAKISNYVEPKAWIPALWFFCSFLHGGHFSCTMELRINFHSISLLKITYTYMYIYIYGFGCNLFPLIEVLWFTTGETNPRTSSGENVAKQKLWPECGWSSEVSGESWGLRSTGRAERCADSAGKRTRWYYLGKQHPLSTVWMQGTKSHSWGCCLSGDGWSQSIGEETSANYWSSVTLPYLSHKLNTDKTTEISQEWQHCSKSLRTWKKPWYKIHAYL